MPTKHDNSAHQDDTSATDLRDFLRALFTGTEGQVFVALGKNPYLNDQGKYTHEEFAQRAYTWPKEAGRIITHLTAPADRCDAYLCVYPMRDTIPAGAKTARALGNAAARTLAHADVDHNVDIDAVKALGGWAVASGTPGHAQVYVRLTYPVTKAQHELLCRGLAKRLGGDHKYADNDMLRAPGTFNLKPTVFTGAPAVPVAWLIRPNGKVDPAVLAEQLGVDIAHAERLNEPTDTGGATDPQHAHGRVAADLAEPVDLTWYPRVQHVLDHPKDADRSRHLHAVVGACISDGLTLAQAHWAVQQRADLAARLAEHPDDVQRSWDKIHRQRAEARNTDPYADVPPPPDAPPNDEERPSLIHRGQARMAYRLTEHEDGKLLHVHGIGWHGWDNQRWRFDDGGKTKRAVLADQRRAWRQAQHDKELAADVRKCESATGVNGTLELAAALEQFAATVKDLDADPFSLNVSNGTLDLHDLELRPHSHTDRITKVCRGAYLRNAPTPVFDAFLARVLPDEDVRGFVQRVIGLALIGEVREHVLIILTGCGANGKGTFYKAVLNALGDYASTADPNLFMHRENAHPTGEMDLLGRRLIVVSETDDGRRLAEATMKRLTGGDPIKARHMRKDFVEFTPSHLPILVTNHLPKVSGDDPAVWRRILVVPFNVVIPRDEWDNTLDAQLQLEADGILSWAVDGLKDYLEHGLNEPDSVRVATDNYQRKSDLIGRFIADRCQLGPVLKATTTDLYKAWQSWQEADGCEPMGRGAFGEALDKRGYPAQPVNNSKRWREGIAVRAGEGIC